MIPCCLWLTGLPGAGKTTLATLLAVRLSAAGVPVRVFDGDVLRKGPHRDLGFSAADRAENIRRVAEMAHTEVEAGGIAVVSLVSPFAADRAAARRRFALGAFFEVFVDAPSDTCRQRDPKGLYARALRGEILNFTGVDGGYEPPAAPEIHLCTAKTGPEACVEVVLRKVGAGGTAI